MPSLLAGRPASFVLVGARLTGKSALLRHIETRALAAAEDGHPAPWRPLPVRIDCALLDSPQTLWPRLLGALAAGAAEEQGRCSQAEFFAGEAHSQQECRRLIAELSSAHRSLLLLLDNFDQLLARSIKPAEFCNELYTLTATIGLVITSCKPLYDLNSSLAGASLVSNSTQLFLGLLERTAALQWITFELAEAADSELAAELLSYSGRHPFLLHKLGDCLAELAPLGLTEQATGHALLPFLRLRFAEHGRPLFLDQWALLHDPPPGVSPQALSKLVERLQRGPLGVEAVDGEWLPALNWLINQAMIAYSASREGLAYLFYSPLFNEFLAHVTPVVSTPAQSVAPVAPSVYEALTKIEASLLRYLEEHSQRVISTEQLLSEVWKRPEASSRRVEEAVRRLRLQLEQQSPPVGEIKNERGRGYRFVPAQPTMRLPL